MITITSFTLSFTVFPTVLMIVGRLQAFPAEFGTLQQLSPVLPRRLPQHCTLKDVMSARILAKRATEYFLLT